MINKYSFLVVFGLFVNSLMAQNVAPAWVNRYAGTGDNSDSYNKIIADGSGNYIGVGYTYRNGNYRDWLIVKLNANLDTLWTRHKKGTGGGDDEAVAAVADGSGNIYVTGFLDQGNTKDDIGLMKFDADGNVLFDTTYYSSTTAFLDDVPVGIVMNKAGNLVIAGYTTQGTWTLNDEDVFVLEYDILGSLQWTKRWSGAVNGKDEPTAMAADDSGNVYITARSYASIDDNWLTLKLDNGGNIVWTRAYDGINGTDRPAAMAISHTGNIVITGRRKGLNDADFHTLQYTPGGVVMWSKDWVGPAGDDLALAVAIDANNNVYVTGKSDRDLTTNINYDISTVKYNASGVQQWQKFWSGAANNDDIPSAIVVDAAGTIIVCGQTDTDPSLTSTVNDMVTIKYYSDGTSPWQKTYNGSRNTDDIAKTMVVDADGNSFVAGHINQTGEGKDAGVLKYDSLGTLLNTSVYNGEGDYNESGHSIVKDGSGNTYVGGYSFAEANNRDALITKIDPNGNTLITKTWSGIKGDDDELAAIAYDANGFIYGCGYTKVSNQKSNFLVIKYDLNLDTIWTRTYNDSLNQSDKTFGLAVDAAGSVYVTGRADEDPNDTIAHYDVVTIKYDNAGTQKWLQRFNGSANLSDEPLKLILDNSTGHVVVAGYSSNATDNDIVVLSYDMTSGGMVAGFPAVFNNGGRTDEPSDMVVDGTGNIYVSGYSIGTLPDEDYILAKYNSAGAFQWSQLYNGTAGQQDKSDALALDNAGNVLITGHSDTDTDPLVTNYDFATMSYDGAGTLNAGTWPATYSGTAANDDVPVAVAVDPLNNIYVTGQSQEGSSLTPNKDIMTRSYSSQGIDNGLYAEYDGPAGGDDAANAILLSYPDLFITGSSDGTGNNQKDIITLKYDLITLGVKNPAQKASMSTVYPNPFTSSAVITLDGSVSSSRDLNLKVSDVLGNEIESSSNVHAPAIHLQRNNLASGVYNYKVSDGENTIAQGKFLVN